MPAPNPLPAVVVDTSQSPHALLRPVPLGAVRLQDTFWEPRRRVNREITLASQYRRCEETGRIDNFRRAAGKIQGPFQGRYYNDSDVYKWLEACAFALAEGPDPDIEQMMEAVVREIADAQEPDGYLNTYFTFELAGERWSNLKDKHELYCAGHLIQAAIAHFRATGRPTLLDVARRYADYICESFGPEGRVGTCGHQEIELALAELYRLCRALERSDPPLSPLGKGGSSPANEEQAGVPRKYLEQARLFIERRGQTPPVIGGSPYHQDHAPFRELTEVVGHAVRMVYYCCGAADVVAETRDAEYRAALERLWQSMVHRRTYVTGGIGSRYEGEAFGEDYELPNDRAYAESCAAIGSAMWNWRMLQLAGEARFADVMENALYNGMLPGLSLQGDEYFYQNPLADTGKHRRTPWFECSCCPPNIARMLASLPAYFHSTSDQGLWLHLYGESSVDAEVRGEPVTLRQTTRYPWDGEILVTIERAPRSEFSLFLRIPGWCTDASLSVNGDAVPLAAGPNGYAEARRRWTAGDEVRLRLPMPVVRVESHPYVTNNAGRVALRRGPLVYCVEQVDVGADPRDLMLPPTAELSTTWEPDLLGGVVTLRGPAQAMLPGPGWATTLHAIAGENRSAASETIPFTAVPYYAWANRDPGGMAVWLQTC